MKVQLDVKIEVREVGEKEAVIALSGKMDFYSSPLLLKEISTLVEKGRPFIVLDLSDLDYLDSTVARPMIAVQERVCQLGGDIQLVSPRSSVSETLSRITGLDQAFRLYESVEEALDSWNYLERGGHLVGSGAKKGYEE